MSSSSASVFGSFATVSCSVAGLTLKLKSDDSAVKQPSVNAISALIGACLSLTRARVNEHRWPVTFGNQHGRLQAGADRSAQLARRRAGRPECPLAHALAPRGAVPVGRALPPHRSLRLLET